MAPERGEIEAVGAALDRLLDEVVERQTEAAESARARSESEERYRGLIELSPDAVIRAPNRARSPPRQAATPWPTRSTSEK